LIGFRWRGNQIRHHDALQPQAWFFALFVDRCPVRAQLTLSGRRTAHAEY
jgi:hypothetical protein